MQIEVRRSGRRCFCGGCSRFHVSDDLSTKFRIIKTILATYCTVGNIHQVTVQE